MPLNPDNYDPHDSTNNAADFDAVTAAYKNGHLFNKSTENADSITEGATKKFMTAAEKTKLGEVNENAEVNQSDAEIKSQYEANPNTNAFTDAEKTQVANHEATLDITTVNLSGSTFPIDLVNKKALDVEISSVDSTAKSITIANVPISASKVVVGIWAKFTTACAVTFPTGTNFVDGAPTFADGEEWLISLISDDAGTSWKGLYRQVA